MPRLERQREPRETIGPLAPLQGVRALHDLSPILRSGLAALAGRTLGELAALPVFALCLGLFVLSLERRRIARLLLAAALGAASAVPAAELCPLPAPADAGFVDFDGTALGPLVRESFGQRAVPLRIGGRRLVLVLRDRGEGPTLHPGDRLHGRALLQPTRQGGVRLVSARRLVRVEARASPLTRLRTGLVELARGTWRRGLAPQHEALVALLVLGQREDLDPELRRGHQDLGLAHLLAISGLHTVFVAGLLLAALRLLRPGRRTWPWLAACLLVYAWVTGFRPPVVRAALAATLWVAGREQGHRFGLGGALALGLWTTLLLFPADFGSLSFCLSYVAVASLAAIPPLFARWRPSGWRGRIYDAYVVSFAAQAGTSALGLAFFGILAPLGALLTPLVLPLVFAMLALGLVTPLVHAVLPGFGVPLLGLLDLVAAVYLDCVRSLEGLPGAPIHARTLEHRELALVLLAVGLGLALGTRSRRLWLASCVLACVPFFVLGSGRDARPRFELLAVGHGLCALAQGPFGTALFDCGDSFGGRIAERRVLAALDRLGRRRIDLLFVSHGDVDHYSALPGLLARVAVGRLIVPECPEMDGVTRLARRRGIPVTVVPTGASVGPAEGLRVVLPLAEGELEGGNSSAFALEITLPGALRLLVCGDQEEAASRALAERVSRPRLLVLPHHGELHVGLVPLLERLRPAEIWISAGGDAELLRRWFAEGFGPLRPLLTALEGDLRLVRGADGTYRIETEFGRVVPR